MIERYNRTNARVYDWIARQRCVTESEAKKENCEVSRLSFQCECQRKGGWFLCMLRGKTTYWYGCI